MPFIAFDHWIVQPAPYEPVTVAPVAPMMERLVRAVCTWAAVAPNAIAAVVWVTLLTVKLRVNVPEVLPLPSTTTVVGNATSWLLAPALGPYWRTSAVLAIGSESHPGRHG